MTDRQKPEQHETIAEMEAEARPGPEGSPHGDDSLMVRFERWDLTRFTAKDAVRSVLLAAFLLLILGGGAVRAASDELDPGLGRDIIKAVGKPTGWVSDQLPFSKAREDATAWLDPDEELKGPGFEAGQDSPRAAPTAVSGPAEGSELDSVLVTGDSLSTPLDNEVAQLLAPDGVEVTRDPHLATGISNPALVDWAQLSATQVDDHHPQAVVVFIGANEGYPMPVGPNGSQVGCCGPEWAAEFQRRVGQMMDTYLQDGDARVYWLTVPTQRDPDRAPINQTVNTAIRAAAEERGDAVQVVDMIPTFTPGEKYRDSIEVDGEQKIVRESDGIHLNDVGSAVAAGIVLDAIDEDFSH
jgi:lysophospholipase L1-like esterase